MKQVKTIFISIVLIVQFATAQTVNHTLTGYWHNWNNLDAPYIELSQINNSYNIINIAFAIPKNGSDYIIDFTPDKGTKAEFKNQIQSLKNNGKKVVISIGGATAPIALNNQTEKDSFVSSVSNILNYYNFDGIDIDFEGTSLSISGGTISNPVDASVINLIDAIKQIMGKYYLKNNKKMFLSMAPETAFVQGGMSAYSGIWGAYLPLINALRDSIDLIQVQLYNSGTMFGIDSKIYTQGTSDFILAMTEALIVGFNTSGGKFDGIAASKISVGLPACSKAAGGGFIDTISVYNALKYLMGKGNKPGNYTLSKPGGYPDLKGLMTWSINWDATNTCGNLYEFANNFDRIFKTTAQLNKLTINSQIEIFPNPAYDILNITTHHTKSENNCIEIVDYSGKTLYKREINLNENQIDISHFKSGLYFIKINGLIKKLTIQH